MDQLAGKHLEPVRSRELLVTSGTRAPIPDNPISLPKRPSSQFGEGMNERPLTEAGRLIPESPQGRTLPPSSKTLEATGMSSGLKR